MMVQLSLYWLVYLHHLRLTPLLCQCSLVLFLLLSFVFSSSLEQLLSPSLIHSLLMLNCSSAYDDASFAFCVSSSYPLDNKSIIARTSAGYYKTTFLCLSDSESLSEDSE